MNGATLYSRLYYFNHLAASYLPTPVDLCSLWHSHLTFSVNKSILSRVAGSFDQLFFRSASGCWNQDTEI